MLSSSTEQRERPADQPGDLATLIQASFKAADADVERQLGVPKSFQDKFISEVETEVERLAASAQGILVREFRQDLDRLVTTIRAMARSCRNDPQDIDEELTLPSITRDIADAAEEYALHVSRPNGRQIHGEKLAAIETDIKEVRLPWARRLLDRMTANDTLPAAERLKLTSSFFKEK